MQGSKRFVPVFGDFVLMFGFRTQRFVVDDASRFRAAKALAGEFFDSFSFAVLPRAFHVLRVARVARRAPEVVYAEAHVSDTRDSAADIAAFRSR